MPMMCRVYDVSPSGYYAWLGRLPSKREQENARLELEIRAAHQRTRETYGPERLKDNLDKHGVMTTVYRVKKLRSKLGIRCKQIKKFKATTNSNHDMLVAANLLDQKFTATAPNQVWLTNITYVQTDEDWLYLAGHKDMFTGDLVGYAMSERMNTGNCLISLACWPRMSRMGNCYDNAPMESFWGLLKNELVHHRKFKTRAEATHAIIEYIEIFYRRERTQARLGYLSPSCF